MCRDLLHCVQGSLALCVEASCIVPSAVQSKRWTLICAASDSLHFECCLLFRRQLYLSWDDICWLHPCSVRNAVSHLGQGLWLEIFHYYYYLVTWLCCLQSSIVSIYRWAIWSLWGLWPASWYCNELGRLCANVNWVTAVNVCIPCWNVPLHALPSPIYFVINVYVRSTTMFLCFSSPDNSTRGQSPETQWNRKEIKDVINSWKWRV